MNSPLQQPGSCLLLIKKYFELEFTVGLENADVNTIQCDYTYLMLSRPIFLFMSYATVCVARAIIKKDNFVKSDYKPPPYA